MSDRAVALAGSELDEVFPFHFAIDSSGTIVRAGPALLSVYPDAGPGSPLNRHFRAQRPRLPLDFETLFRSAGSLLVLESLDERLRLRGQIVRLGDSDTLLFVGSPWISDLSELKPLGLSLDDLPPHNPLAELLFLIRAKEVATEEYRTLAERLQERETELRETATRLSAILSTAGEGIVTMDAAGTILSYNEAAERIFGYDAEEVVGGNVAVLMTESDGTAHGGYVARYLETGEGTVVGTSREVTGQHRDGTLLPLQLSVSEAETSQGPVFTGILRDLREAKSFERSMNAQHAVLRELVQSKSELATSESVLRTLCKSLELNAGSIWLTRRRDELECVAFWADDVSEMRPLRDASLQQVIGHGEGLPGRVLASGEHLLVRDLLADPDLPLAPVAHSCGLRNALAFPVIGERGVLGVLLGFSVEQRPTGEPFMETVTALGREIGLAFERDRAERSVTASEVLLRSIIETSLDAVIVIDGHGRITDWNSQAVRIFGWSSDEVLGRRLADVVVPEHLREGHRKGLARYMETGTGAVIGRRIEVPGLHRNGTEMPIELTISPIREGPTEDDFRFAGFLRDLSEQRKAEAEIEKAREREIAVGASIQETFLRGEVPEQHPCFEIAMLSVPSLQLDGDFTDFLVHDDTCVDVVVGDVMGKGIPAALLGAATKSQFSRSITELLSRGEAGLPAPEDVVQQVHGAVVQRLIEVESFVTAVYARFDSRDCTITFVDCGHPKALYVPGDSDRAHRLVGSSLPFGFLQDYTYRQDTAPLAEGDTVVLYTDGVTEVFSPEGEMFGEARLQQLVEQLARRPPAKIIDGIRDSLERHAKSTAFRDDLTLVALRVRSTRTQAKTAPKEESLNIARDLAELSRVRDAISEFLHSSHASPASVFVGRVQLAVQEALTNILRHTTGRAPADGVEIRIKREGPGVAVTLLYEGDELFRPTSTRLPEVEDYPSGGFGLYLIQESVDSFEYDRSEDGRMKILLYAEPPDDPDTSSESAVPSDS